MQKKSVYNHENDNNQHSFQYYTRFFYKLCKKKKKWQPFSFNPPLLDHNSNTSVFFVIYIYMLIMNDYNK